jgi:hypothetical protein
MLASTHFEENESSYRFKLLDYMDEIASQNSHKIAGFIEDVHNFEQFAYNKATSQKPKGGKRQTRSQDTTKKATKDDTKAAAVKSKVADVSTSSQSSSLSTSATTAYDELLIEVSKLQGLLEKSKKDQKKAESNTYVSYKF